MKISTVWGATTIIVTSIVGVMTIESATAQWVPNESMFESYTNDRLNRMRQPGNRNSDGSIRGTTKSPVVRISEKAAVMYIKDETLDSDIAMDDFRNQNVEMGFVESEVEVTVVKQTERMMKVRFEENGRLGWVSKKAIVGL